MGSLSNVPNDSPFTLENIPFGVFSTAEDASPRCATAIGDYAVDLRALSESGVFTDALVSDALSQVRCILAREYGNTVDGAIVAEEYKIVLTLITSRR